MIDLPLDAYTPPLWLRGPHAQTMIGRVLRLKPELSVRRERWETPDGDFLDLDVLDPDRVAPRGIVLILHGLEGSSTRSYVRLTLAHLQALGLRGIAVNFRSCSGALNRRARFYHSGETGDLAHVISRVKREDPEMPLAAIGFSLGGNVLLKYLGEMGAQSEVVGAVAVSVPFDLATGARLIGSGAAGRVYTHYFLRSLKQKLAAKAERLAEDQLDPTMVRRGIAATSLLSYDDAVTAPLHGFANAAAYYEASSSAQWIPSIRTPTVALHAADDPFLPQKYLPIEMFARNPHVRLHVTKRGGHLGFLESDSGLLSSTCPEARLRLRCWAERVAAKVAFRLVETAANSGKAIPIPD